MARQLHEMMSRVGHDEKKSILCFVPHASLADSQSRDKS
jgi:hypothetical protein